MKNIEHLLEVMERLRDPQKGCPWDKQQTFASLIPYTLEESYEVADAIEKQDYTELQQELGDLLFQVVFYAQIAREQGLFDFDDVAGSISEKLIRRHPHVFADEKVDSVEQQTAAWEEHKRKEREKKVDKTTAVSELDGVIKALPALSRAQKLQRRAARVGFDWENIDDVYAKLSEEAAEVKQAVTTSDPQAMEGEVGDLVFSCVNLARSLDIDTEEATRKACLKFERRFRSVESKVAAQQLTLSDLSAAQLDSLWQAVKAEEKS